MSFFELAKERYSLRAFDGRPVEPEALQKILEAGRIAPTAKNSQPFKVYVLQSEDALEKANRLSKCIYGSTTVLMVCELTDVMWQNPFDEGVDMGEVDTSIVTTHMMLEAQDLGIGSCWVGLFSPSQAKAVFELPENENPVALLPLGYPKEGAAPADRHTQRKPLEELVEYK